MKHYLHPLRSAIALCALVCMSVSASAAEAANGALLTARYATLDQQLKALAFGRPLVLESTDTPNGPNGPKGDVYTTVDQPINKDRWGPAITASVLKPSLTNAKGYFDHPALAIFEL